MHSDTSATEAELERAQGFLAGDPANPLLLRKAVDLCLGLGRVAAARQHTDAALNAAPGDAQLRHLHGTVLIAQGMLDEAEPVFQALLREIPDPNIAFNLALVRYRRHRFADARAALERFMQDSDANLQAITLYLRILHQLGELADAIALLRREMPRCAGDAQFLAAASLLLFDDNQLQEAQRLSDAALAGGARPLEALVVAGSLALGRDDAVGATKLLNEALAINPSDGRSWAGLGMASLLQGDTAGAKDHLERAVASLPTHIGTLHALGWCHILRGELAQAEQIFDKALALDRNFGESHGGLAAVHALQGKHSDAEQGVQRALRLDAQSLSARYAQMVMSGAVNDPEKFRKLALQAVSHRRGAERSMLANALSKRSR